MANIFDYLIWRGDVPFSVSPFNEVDSLVLAELIYTDFSGCVPQDGTRVTIGEARSRFWEKHSAEEILAQNSFSKLAPFLMDHMADQARFSGTELAWYCNVVDPAADVQLAAVTFFLADGTVFVAFRGTDGSLVGWKEDFLMSYLPETEGQRRAVQYIIDHFSSCSLPLRLGGHSKGGNLAVFAAVRAPEEIRSRVLQVYDNDGPGFLAPFTQTEAYRGMTARIVCTVPENTVIGTLLTSKAYQHVVKSSASGIMQHNGLTWQVLGKSFVEAEGRSEGSLLIESTLREWLAGQDESNRRLFVGTLFDLLESTGADTLSQIRQDKLRALSNMKKMLDTMEKERREAVWNALLELIRTGSENMIQDARRSLLNRLEALGIHI